MSIIHDGNFEHSLSDNLPIPNLDDMNDIAAAEAGLPGTSCPFHSLPAEILLDIVSSVPFTPANFFALHLTCRRFHDILTHHEGPIAAATRRQTFDAKTVALFPGLKEESLRNLGRLHTRVETLAAVHEQFLKITHNSPELEWLKGRFQGVHKAGLLLLYHLQDLRLRPAAAATQEGLSPICEHCQRVLFIRSLPATSLACLLFKLISSVRILRIFGPEPIRESWKKGDAGARSEVELVCEELILRNGPWFFVALMDNDVRPAKNGSAVGYGSSTRSAGFSTLISYRRLQAELANLAYRQSPIHPPTLISSLRRALAEKTMVDIRLTMSKMWEILASSGFDDLEGNGGLRMAKIVRGEELTGEERGLKRIF